MAKYHILSSLISRYLGAINHIFSHLFGGIVQKICLALYALLSISALIGCQQQYEPLISTYTPLESRTLEGPMSNSWNDQFEPIVQNNCIQCHSVGDPLNTGLQFSVLPLTSQYGNLINALKFIQREQRFNLSINNHSAISKEEQSIVLEFEKNALTYWHWQSEIAFAQTQANEYFIENIEADIIQPVCTGCHIILDDNENGFSGELSFYNYNVENHTALNSQQAMDFLINSTESNLIFLKAIGQRNHGGISAIQSNSVYSNTLEQHSGLVNDVIQLINTQPNYQFNFSN